MKQTPTMCTFHTCATDVFQNTLILTFRQYLGLLGGHSARNIPNTSIILNAGLQFFRALLTKMLRHVAWKTVTDIPQECSASELTVSVCQSTCPNIPDGLHRPFGVHAFFQRANLLNLTNLIKVHYNCTRVGVYVMLQLYMYISTRACGLRHSAALDIQIREF